MHSWDPSTKINMTKILGGRHMNLNDILEISKRRVYCIVVADHSGVIREGYSAVAEPTSISSDIFAMV
jgi:hypothetical protein